MQCPVCKTSMSEVYGYTRNYTDSRLNAADAYYCGNCRIYRFLCPPLNKTINEEIITNSNKDE